MALLVGRNVMIVDGKQKVETDDAITRDRTPGGPFSARARGRWRNYDALWYCLARCRDVGSDYNIFFFCSVLFWRRSHSVTVLAVLCCD